MKTTENPLLYPSQRPQGSSITVLRAVVAGVPRDCLQYLPTSAPRWPRTLAGITAYQSCLQYPFTSVPLSGGAPGTRASRRCDRAGRWEPGDYSHCLYTNDITRVLYTFVLVRLGEEGAGSTPSALVPGMGWDEALGAAGEGSPAPRLLCCISCVQGVLSGGCAQGGLWVSPLVPCAAFEFLTRPPSTPSPLFIH